MNKHPPIFTPPKLRRRRTAPHVDEAGVAGAERLGIPTLDHHIPVYTEPTEAWHDTSALDE